MKDANYLSVLQSYLRKLKLNQNWQAIYNIQRIKQESNDPSMLFTCYCFHKNLELEVAKAEFAQMVSTGLDIFSVINVQTKYSEFLLQLKTVQELYEEFWREVILERPRPSKINEIGSKINLTNDRINLSYNNLLEGTTNQSRFHKLYGDYLSYIVNREYEARKVLFKYQNIANSLQSKSDYTATTKLRFADIATLSLIISSGEKDTMGQLLKVNTELLKLLGYVAEELRGANLKLLMPKIYADEHDK